MLSKEIDNRTLVCSSLFINLESEIVEIVV